MLLKYREPYKFNCALYFAATQADMELFQWAYALVSYDKRESVLCAVRQAAAA
jgi:hypothetical protein